MDKIFFNYNSDTTCMKHTACKLCLKDSFCPLYLLNELTGNNCKIISVVCVYVCPTADPASSAISIIADQYWPNLDTTPLA